MNAVFAVHLAITIIKYGAQEPRHDRKDSRLSIVPIAQFVVGIAGMVGVVIGGCAVLPVSSC